MDRFLGFPIPGKVSSVLLSAANICKTYRTRDGIFEALYDVSVDVDAGQIVGLIGASGSGKSTMASIIIGLETADAGRIEFDGASCDANLKMGKRNPDYRRAMAGMQMVFQNPTASFSDRMRVGAGIEEGIAYRGVPKPERTQRMLETLEMVGLPAHYAEKHAWELSGGECQRAAIARAIISHPKLLICDEPTSALDVTIQAQIVHLLDDLCRDMGMACLFISHDLALVRGLCTNVYVMDAGHIVESGTPADILHNPSSAAAQQLVESIIEF